ncbi:unnamed protein product [Rhizophagus irregularis]|uniref:Uncharacterized protein n=1 Tax=Rhizophagus irregularis TaxID=588596 RepID=A0A915ZHW0_9GLOM|nr:unnamed protein product [Rhizophagus irregularis]
MKEIRISRFRWFFQVTLGDILVKFFIYFFLLGGSFVFLATVRPLDMRNFQRQVRPLDGIGILKCYRRALIGYLEIGDNLGSFKTSCYWTNCFGVLKRVEFRIILSILNNG